MPAVDDVFFVVGAVVGFVLVVVNIVVFVGAWLVGFSRRFKVGPKPLMRTPPPPPPLSKVPFDLVSVLTPSPGASPKYFM